MTKTWQVVTSILAAATLVVSGVILGVLLAREGGSAASLAAITQANRELGGLMREVHDEQHAFQREFKAGVEASATEQKELQSKIEGLVLGREAAAPEAGLPAPPSGMVTVKLAWEYKRVPGEFLLFKPLPEAKQWDTVAVGPGVEVRTGEAIKDGVLFLKPDEDRLVQVIWRNPQDKAQSFFVVPHIVNPSKHQADTPWMCMCTGQNFEVPAKGTLSRVFHVKVTPDVPPGAKLIGTHTVVGPMGPM